MVTAIANITFVGGEIMKHAKNCNGKVAKYNKNWPKHKGFSHTKHHSMILDLLHTARTILLTSSVSPLSYSVLSSLLLLCRQAAWEWSWQDLPSRRSLSLLSRETRCSPSRPRYELVSGPGREEERVEVGLMQEVSYNTGPKSLQCLLLAVAT